jgi:hypothetical protein
MAYTRLSGDSAPSPGLVRGWSAHAAASAPRSMILAPVPSNSPAGAPLVSTAAGALSSTM